MWKQCLCLCSIMLVIFSGCSQKTVDISLYQQAFDDMLQMDKHVKEMDYISLFIYNEAIKEKDYKPIKKYLHGKYEKEIHSYAMEELQEQGAYGKEDLNQEGIYLYITEIEDKDDHMKISSESYSTLEEVGKGMEMTFIETKKSWQLDDMTIIWEESLE